MVLLLLTLKQHDSLERQATYLMSLWNPDETLMSHRTARHRSDLDPNVRTAEGMRDVLRTA